MKDNRDVRERSQVTTFSPLGENDLNNNDRIVCATEAAENKIN